MNRLSVVLIAKNEEHNLPRAISSVTEVADEIVVVDTGSEDRTVDIAKEMGAKVFHFPWVDDFSAARNYAVDQASGDWILWLDADEALLPESVALIRPCVENKKALAYYVLRRDLVDADKPELFTEMWQLRLFRNRPDMRFRGRCHPDFHPTANEIANAEGLTVEPSEIRLVHYGYVGGLRLKKLERSANLLELELRDRPGRLYYMIEYGRTLLLLGDRRAERVIFEAAQALAPSLEDQEPPLPLAAALLETLLQFPSKQLPEGYTRARMESAAMRWFPDSAPLNWLFARRAFQKEDFASAEKHLERLVWMGRTGQYDRHIGFHPEIIGDDAKLNYAVSLVRQAKLSEAETVFNELLDSPSRKKEAKANLKTIRNLKNRYSAAKKKRKKHR